MTDDIFYPPEIELSETSAYADTLEDLNACLEQDLTETRALLDEAVKWIIHCRAYTRDMPQRDRDNIETFLQETK